MSRKGKRGQKPQPPEHQDEVGQALDITVDTIPAEEAADFNHNEKHQRDNVMRVHVATPAYDGKVDADGRTTATINWPVLTALRGMKIYAGGWTGDVTTQPIQQIFPTIQLIYP